MSQEEKLKTEINNALKRLKSLLENTSWVVYKQGSYGIVAYNTSTLQKIRTVYALYAEDFVDRVLTEIRTIEANNE